MDWWRRVSSSGPPTWLLFQFRNTLSQEYILIINCLHPRFQKCILVIRGNGKNIWSLHANFINCQKQAAWFRQGWKITHSTIISSILNYSRTGKCVIRSHDLCVKQKLATLLQNCLLQCGVQIQRVIEKGYLGAWWSLVGVFALQLDLHKFLSKWDKSCTINLSNWGAKNSHKEQSYIASRSEQHWRWYVDFLT